VGPSYLEHNREEKINFIKYCTINISHVTDSYRYLDRKLL